MPKPTPSPALRFFLLFTVVGVTACGDPTLQPFGVDGDRPLPRPVEPVVEPGAQPDDDGGVADADGGVGAPVDAGASEPDDAGVVVDDGFTGFIGAPCQTNADCPYEGGVCLTDGYDRGTCSQACDLYCPDDDGAPTTFCVASDELDGDAATLGDGACFSRCDFGMFPGSGCRPGYGCQEAARANQPDTLGQVCLPGESDIEQDDCLAQLGMLGVDFTPTVIADRSPDGNPNLTCHVENPVRLHPPILGVDFVYYDGSPTPNITMSCEGALALVETAGDVVMHDVEAVRHIGTYVCRTISGTQTLSRHSFGDAIDIWGFDMDDGSLITLEDHWEHDTESFTTDEAEFLYNAGQRWHDAHIWSIILTPNYNAAHDNHFHIDLTPDTHFIHSLGGFAGGYYGPAPYAD